MPRTLHVLCYCMQTSDTGVVLQRVQPLSSVAQSTACSTIFFCYAAEEKCLPRNVDLYIMYCGTVELVHNAFKIFIVPTFS